MSNGSKATLEACGNRGSRSPKPRRLECMHTATGSRAGVIVGCIHQHSSPRGVVSPVALPPWPKVRPLALNAACSVLRLASCAAPTKLPCMMRAWVTCTAAGAPSKVLP